MDLIIENLDWRIGLPLLLVNAMRVRTYITLAHRGYRRDQSVRLLSLSPSIFEISFVISMEKNNILFLSLVRGIIMQLLR